MTGYESKRAAAQDKLEQAAFDAWWDTQPRLNETNPASVDSFEYWAWEGWHAALAQPAQEPVGDDWTPCMKLPVVVYVRQQRPDETHVSTREGITPVKPDDLIMRGVSGEEYPIGRAIFEQTYTLDTSPPSRPWVDLTDNQIEQIYHDLVKIHRGAPMPWGQINFGKVLQAALRSKNK